MDDARQLGGGGFPNQLREVTHLRKLAQSSCQTGSGLLKKSLAQRNHDSRFAGDLAGAGVVQW